MPVLNGFETAKRIREMMKKNVVPYAPIVALTANVATNDVANCLECGMEYYLSKPVSKKVFRSKIMEVMLKQT